MSSASGKSVTNAPKDRKDIDKTETTGEDRKRPAPRTDEKDTDDADRSRRKRPKVPKVGVFI